MADIMKNLKERFLIDLAVADILSKRFSKVLKTKGIDVEEFAQTLGSDWYVPCFHRKSYRDGTFDPVSRNILNEFITGKGIFLPNKAALRLLESRLGYKENEILTLYDHRIDLKQFLIGCGYIDQYGQRTRRFDNSPRIKAYNKAKIERQKELEKAQREAVKAQQKAKKAKQQNLFRRIKKLALGQFEDMEVQNGK